MASDPPVGDFDRQEACSLRYWRNAESLPPPEQQAHGNAIASRHRRHRRTRVAGLVDNPFLGFFAEPPAAGRLAGYLH
jgi:hypothetical protein